MLTNLLLLASGAPAAQPSSNVEPVATVIGVMLTLVSLGGAAFAWRIQRRKERLEFENAIRNAWIQIDLAVAGDPALLRIADQMCFRTSHNFAITTWCHLDPGRRRWLTLAMMNLYAARYLAAHNKLFSGAECAEYMQGAASGMQHLYALDDCRFAIEMVGYERWIISVCKGEKPTMP